MNLSNDLIAEIKSANNIKEIAESYGCRFNNANRCPCPLHNGKDNNFAVYEDTNTFRCYVCGEGGDVVRFIEKIEGFDFIEAIELLAKRAGIKFEDSAEKNNKKTILEINKFSANYFFKCLLKTKGVPLNYLYNRGIGNLTIKTFALGYSDGNLHFELAKKFSQKDIADSGLCRTYNSGGKFYDFFRNRIIFPIQNAKGDVIGFGGRSLDETNPKYINTHENIVYKKRENLYGMNFAKNVLKNILKSDAKDKPIILCEGYLDVISLHQSGFNTAVAGLGTALTEEQVKLVKKSTSNVVLCYDSDSAGIKATRRAIEMFSKAEILPKIIDTNPAKDPDEYIRNYGKERFETLIKKSIDAVDYQINIAGSEYNLTDPNEQVQYINEVKKILQSVKDKTALEIYENRAVAGTDFSKEQLHRMIFKERNFIQKKKYDEEEIRATTSLSEKREILLLNYFVRNREKMTDNFISNYFTSDILREIYVLLEQNAQNSDVFGILYEYIGQNKEKLYSKLVEIVNLPEIDRIDEKGAVECLEGMKHSAEKQKRFNEMFELKD
ncbi:MAG: DNA primase [Ruminococcus sp.]|jgi:DNA primase|nr:DNA primase [Ruminococcus sp.]